MIEIYSFIAGIGFFMWVWFGLLFLYEIIRHKSMLEYQYPNISIEHILFIIFGFILWTIGGYFS
jgi:uncharacterized protein with PQ loop repeat